jgi:hypothetical protein
VSTAEQSRAAPQGGPKFWFAVLGGIVAWLTHLFIVSSFVRYTCNVRGHTEWVEHVATLVTALITLAALGLCVQYLRTSGRDRDESAGTPWGRTRFLATFGVLSNSVNLLLILAEGAYVFVIRPACG